MSLSCQRCGKCFKLKHNLAQHLSKKTPCPSTKSDLSQEQCLTAISMPRCQYTCNECGKTFTTKSKLSYHLDQRVCCKTATTTTKVPSARIRRHESNIHNTTNNNTNNNTINNTNNNTNNIQLNINFATGKHDFGSERLDHITPEMIRGYLEDIFKGIGSFIDDVHHNHALPENQNVKLFNLKQRMMTVVKNGEESVVPSAEVARRVVSKMRNVLLEYIEPLIDCLDQTLKYNSVDEDMKECFWDNNVSLGEALASELNDLRSRLADVREHMVMQYDKQMKNSEGRNYTRTCKIAEAHMVGKKNFEFDSASKLQSHVQESAPTVFNHPGFKAAKPMRLTAEVLDLHSQLHVPESSRHPDKWPMHMYNIRTSRSVSSEMCE